MQTQTSQNPQTASPPVESFARAWSSLLCGLAQGSESRLAFAARRTRIKYSRSSRARGSAEQPGPGPPSLVASCRSGVRLPSALAWSTTEWQPCRRISDVGRAPGGCRAVGAGRVCWLSNGLPGTTPHESRPTSAAQSSSSCDWRKHDGGLTHAHSTYPN